MSSIGRSPNYPTITLREAIERVKKVYSAQHHYSADKNVVAQTLGYGGLNGKSLTVIGALKRYALLQADGDKLRVSDDAISIIQLPEDNKERAAALSRAAFATPVFADIHNAYGDKLPVDAVLRHDLMKRKFLTKAADEVIRIYRDNLELVTPLASDYTAGESSRTQTPSEAEDEEPKQEPVMQPNPASQPVPKTPTPTKGAYEFSFPLSFQRDVRAVVTIYGEEIRRRDLEFLKKKVDDLLEGFEDEDMVQPED